MRRPVGRSRRPSISDQLGRIRRELRGLREQGDATLEAILELQTDPAKVEALAARVKAVRKALVKAMRANAPDSP